MEVVGILVVVLVAGLAIWFSWYQTKKRRELMAGIAARYGGRYYRDDPFGLSKRYERLFPTLSQGSNRYAYNVVEGNDAGRTFWLFDHHHETYSHDKNGRKTHHHHRTFLITEHDVDLGRLDVRPEGFFDKLKAAFGFDDIDFESAEFSRRWHVGAKNREFAYQVFHPRMIEYFLTLDGFRMQTAGAYSICRVGSGRMGADELARVFRYSKGFRERLPRFVRKDRAL